MNDNFLSVILNITEDSITATLKLSSSYFDIMPSKILTLIKILQSEIHIENLEISRFEKTGDIVLERLDSLLNQKLLDKYKIHPSKKNMKDKKPNLFIDFKIQELNMIFMIDKNAIPIANLIA